MKSVAPKERLDRLVGKMSSAPSIHRDFKSLTNKLIDLVLNARTFTDRPEKSIKYLQDAMSLVRRSKRNFGARWMSARFEKWVKHYDKEISQAMKDLKPESAGRISRSSLDRGRLAVSRGQGGLSRIGESMSDLIFRLITERR